MAESLLLKISEEILETKRNSEVVPKILAWLRNYAENNINSRLIDERRTIPPNIVLDFGNKGLLGMNIDEEYGGLNLNYDNTFKIIEQLAAIDTSLAIFVGLNNVLGVRPILRFAPEKLKNITLPALARGLELAAFAITEPGAGSNPRGMSSTAVPDGKGGWLINGEKMWIGSGSWANYMNVFVNLMDDDNKLIGVTGFVIRRDTPGLLIGEESLTMGVRGLVQNRIYFHNVRVTPENLLGDMGKGFEIAQDTMRMGRAGLCVISLGAMKRCYTLAYHYATHRKIITGPMIENPLIVEILKTQALRIDVIQSLVSYICYLLDNGESIPEELSLTCKILGPEFLWQTADELMQMLGGRGYIETNAVPQIFRDARLLRIFEGPTETMAFYLGMLMLQKKVPLLQLSNHQETVNSLRSKLNPKNKDLNLLSYNLGILGAYLIAKVVVCIENEDPILEDWLDKQIEAKVSKTLSKDLNYKETLKELAERNEEYLKEVGFNEGKAPEVDFETDPLLKKL